MNSNPSPDRHDEIPSCYSEGVDELQLFQRALGLTPPWTVTRTKLDPSDSKLDLWIDFLPGSRFACPKCGTMSCPAYDTKQTTWRHLDFFQYRTFLHVRHPRVECPTCGIHRVDVPWARPESGFTFLFEAMVMAMAPHMPVAAMARHVREHDTRVWRILQYHVNEARSRADHSGVKQVGLDETSKGKGHDYVTLFVDLNPLKRCVLYATPGKDASTVTRFTEDLKQHDGDPAKIVDVCMDMSVAFQSGVKASLPEAVITFDKYHIVKLLNEAVDEVRRQEQRGNPGLKNTRFLWLQKGDNLGASAKERVVGLSNAFPRTGLAYRLKESFMVLWDQPAARAEAFLRGWQSWAIRSRLPPFREFCEMVKDHWSGIVRWFESRIANGVLEGINSLVQAAKAKARGYRSDRNLITMVYLLAGKLNYQLPT